MRELAFTIDDVEPLLHAAAPALVFKLGVSRSPHGNTDAAPDAGGSIHSILLRCQLRIEPTRRPYEPANREWLTDLFGEPDRWSRTLRSMLWTHTSAVVPAFDDRGQVDLIVPCGYDFSLAATKYFYALEAGDVPLSLLLSGTVFYAAEDGRLQVAQLPWDQEIDYPLPVATWRAMIDHYYPRSVPLWLHRDAFEKLYAYRLRHGLTTWEQTLARLLDSVEQEVSP